MPKEQGHFGERVARGSSKNAKDKSNCATLRASQSGTRREVTGMGALTNRMLRCDSEKDSGYSEAGSDSVHTDVDDQRSSVSGSRWQSNSNSSVNAAAHSLSPYKEVTPVYVIKNVMVKPSRPDPLLHSPLGWGGGWHGLTGTKGPTQLLLIQQPTIPVPSPIGTAPAQNHMKKLNGRSSKTHKNSYLPILNSYPRIAPHPRKESHESKGGTRVGGAKESGSEGQSQSKRVCTEEEKREAVSTTTHLLKPQQQQKETRVHSHSQYKNRNGTTHRSMPGQASSSDPTKAHYCQQSSSSDSVSSPAVSSSQTPSPPCSSDSSSSPQSSSPMSSVAHSPYCPAPDSTSKRHRRFLNTAEILNQSGLLAITLRTKELLKQNAATEREIAQLRQHTQFLCEAAQASQSDSNETAHTLNKLVQAMSESGSYPELDLKQLKALSNQQSKTRDDEEKQKDVQPTTMNAMPTMMSLHNVNDGTSPPSPLFAPSPETEEREHVDPLEPLPSSLSPLDTEQGHRPAVTEKDLSDLTMLPESSTHNDYLL